MGEGGKRLQAQTQLYGTKQYPQWQEPGAAGLVAEHTVPHGGAEWSLTFGAIIHMLLRMELRRLREVRSILASKIKARGAGASLPHPACPLKVHRLCSG